MIFLGDSDYPPLLAMMDDAPPCLTVCGEGKLALRRCVATVGGRNASASGQRMAETLAAELAATLVMVSGLARVIDTAAHPGAMRTGHTIAVIAGGLDQPYPPENADLHRRIAATHLLITEAPTGTVPQARHFPRRNRIIAGLSLGIVVVEAAPRSGSLITARIAQEAGREIFAIPGSPLDPRARGGNELIRQGAVLVETAVDVLDNLPLEPAERSSSRVSRVRRGGDTAPAKSPWRMNTSPTLRPRSCHCCRRRRQWLTIWSGAATCRRRSPLRFYWNWSWRGV